MGTIKAINWDKVFNLIRAGAGEHIDKILMIRPELLNIECKKNYNVSFEVYKESVLSLEYHPNHHRETIKYNSKLVKEPPPKKIGFVYLINCKGTNLYKIGISKNNIKIRLSTLQSGCPFELIVSYVCQCKHFALLESELHKRYKKYKHRGEWFKLSESLVLCVKNDMIEQKGKQLKLFK